MNRLLSAPEPLVHSVLVALCDNERIQKRALKYLATLEDYAADISADVGPGEDSGGGSSSTATTTTTTTTKPRKRKMMATAPAQLCIMCKGAFSPGDNSPTACAYHDGDLGVDDDSAVWADWDEDVGGPRETSENEEDHPHAFTWSCCEEDGTKPGCVKGYHLAVRQNPSKRFRMSFPPGAEPDRNRVFEGRTLKANEFVNEMLGQGPSHTMRAEESSSSYSDSVRSEGPNVAPQSE